RSVLVLLGGASDETCRGGRSLHCSGHRPNQQSVSAVLLWLARWHLPGLDSCPDGTSWSILLLWVTGRHLQSTPCSAAAISRRRLHSASCSSGRPAGLRTNQKWLVPARPVKRGTDQSPAPLYVWAIVCCLDPFDSPAKCPHDL